MSGPRVVAIGGGHGLATTLRALRRYAGTITAVVSVADDGGSSGRLRELLGIPAPGDLRKCLGALLPASSPLGRALEHRFEAGELAGHAFGNLLLAALAATTGDFVAGVEEAARLLGAVGRVYPATCTPVVLRATAEDGEVEGQVRVMAARRIRRLALVPADAPSPAPVLEALRAADQVVIGPGSLYTSVLAALLPEQLRRALEESSAQKVYVANLREQVAETEGYDVAAHLEALLAHGVRPDVVLADPAPALGVLPRGTPVVLAPVSGPGAGAHDPVRLGDALDLLVQCAPPRTAAGGGPVPARASAAVSKPADLRD